MIAMVVGTCLSLSAIPATAAAAQESETPVAAVTRVRPGEYVRVTTDSETTEGRLQAVRDGRLVLDGPEVGGRLSSGIPSADVRTLSVRGRGTKTGALVGGVVGGVASGALLGVAYWAMCEVDSCLTHVLAGAAIGLVGGGAVGGLTGGLIGSASPEWRSVFSAGSGVALPGSLSLAVEGPAQSGPIGSASLHLGYHKAFDAVAPDGAAGGTVSLTAERGPLSASLELGRYGLGGREVLSSRGEPIHYEESLFHVGPAVSVGPSSGTVRPYALAGLGFYRWKALDPPPHVLYPEYPDLDPESRDQLDAGYEPLLSHDFLGGSLGGGVRVHATSALSFGVEGRWHTNLSAGPYMGPQQERRLSLVSVTGGATLRW